MSETQMLRDVVEERLNRRWSEFAASHPHLAEVIDRTRLVESAVQSLRDDPTFIAAMREANLDVSQLAAVKRAMERADEVVGRVLPVL